MIKRILLIFLVISTFIAYSIACEFKVILHDREYNYYGGGGFPKPSNGWEGSFIVVKVGAVSKVYTLNNGEYYKEETFFANPNETISVQYYQSTTADEENDFVIADEFGFPLINFRGTVTSHTTPLLLDTSFVAPDCADSPWNDFIKNKFIGSECVEVLNAKYIGNPLSVATIKTQGTSLEYDSCILLTTGHANDIFNTYFFTASNALDSLSNIDTDLDSLLILTSSTNSTYNSTVLEFDFIPIANNISFNYIFSSEEYPDYVDKDYNDIFAFLLSGPKPEGGTYNNKNIATVPGQPNTAVSINTVNANDNSDFFVKNNTDLTMVYNVVQNHLPQRHM